jgi:hypothetical protein
MPNNISGVTWFIDTVGTIFTQRVYIKSILWNKPTAGAVLIITDMQGRDLINTVANAADPMFEFSTQTWQNGFVVVQMDSGTLQVVVNK